MSRCEEWCGHPAEYCDCKRKEQCWEPCGDLGNSEEHVQPASTVDAQQIDVAVDQLVESAWAKKSVTPFPRWISVADRLPEDDDWYLVTIKDPSAANSYVCLNQFTDGEFYYFYVTHWMPLPPDPLNEEER